MAGDQFAALRAQRVGDARVGGGEVSFFDRAQNVRKFVVGQLELLPMGLPCGNPGSTPMLSELAQSRKVNDEYEIYPQRTRAAPTGGNERRGIIAWGVQACKFEYVPCTARWFRYACVELPPGLGILASHLNFSISSNRL